MNTNTKIYTLAYGAKADTKTLRKLSAVTHGAFYISPDAAAIPAAYTQALDQLKTAYLIEFRVSQTIRPESLATISLVHAGRAGSTSAVLATGAGREVPVGVWMGGAALLVVIAAGAAVWFRRRSPPSALQETIVVPRAWLEVVRGADAGKKFVLSHYAAVIARDQDHAEIALVNDPLIGRNKHARLTLDAGGRYVIEDLNSKNGVTVNDVRIGGPVILRPNDRIGLGLSELLFIDQR